MYSVKKGALGNFAKFTGKHLRQSLFFNKVAGLRLATLSKRDSGTGGSCHCSLSIPFENIRKPLVF